MISYGSRHRYASMPQNRRSHQLGEGHHCDAAMPISSHPPRLVYGSQILIAKTLCGKRSHQLGEGQFWKHKCHAKSALPNQLGEGHQCGAEMPTWTHPPRLVFGSLCYHAAMPIYDRSHLFTRGHSLIAEMPISKRLSREGSDYARRNANAGLPFPTSFGPPQIRSNANRKTPTYLPEVNRDTQQCHSVIASQGKGQSINTGMSGVVHPSPPVTGGQSWIAEMPKMTRPHQFWAIQSSQQCYVIDAQF